MSESILNNTLAIISAIAAILAALYARHANKLSERQENETFPHFRLVSFTHDPNRFNRYTNVSGGKEGYESLEDPKLKSFVSDDRGSLSCKEYKDKVYFFINLIPEKGNLEDYSAYLFMGTLKTEFVNRSRDAVSFKVIDSHSTLKFGKHIKLKVNDLRLPIREENGVQTITLDVAYAHCDDQEPSILNDKFDYTDTVDFLKRPGEAKRVFNFSDSAFRTCVEDKNKIEQINTVHFLMDDQGSVEIRIDHESLKRKRRVFSLFTAKRKERKVGVGVG